MVNYMGGKFETMGTRERTIISISAGPKAIEELAMDVLVPSLLSPMFFKYEMFFPWDQAKRAAKCPVDNAFHEASFSVSDYFVLELVLELIRGVILIFKVVKFVLQMFDIKNKL